MIFQVFWQQTALDDLTAAWLAAGSTLRAAITSAATDVERQLESDPADQGESRTGGQRIFFSSPLAVLFEVDELALTVFILQVWTYHTRDVH